MRVYMRAHNAFGQTNLRVSCSCWRVILGSSRHFNTAQVGLRLRPLRAAMLLAVAEELQFSSPSRPMDNCHLTPSPNKSPQSSGAAAASPSSYAETTRYAR